MSSAPTTHRPGRREAEALATRDALIKAALELLAAAEPTETEEIDTEASSEGASDSARGPDEAEDEAEGDADDEEEDD